MDTLGASKITSGTMMSRNSRLTLDFAIMVDLALRVPVQLHCVHQTSNPFSAAPTTALTSLINASSLAIQSVRLSLLVSSPHQYLTHSQAFRTKCQMTLIACAFSLLCYVDRGGMNSCVYACIIGHILLSVRALYTLVLAASNLWDCTIVAERDNYGIFNKNGNVLQA